MADPHHLYGYDVQRSLRNCGERLARLIDVGAPEIIIFNEVRLIEDRFRKWCAERGYDPDGPTLRELAALEPAERGAA